MADTAPLFAGIGGHHSARARTDEWLTPPELLTALGGADSFDLDPCAPIVRPWPTARDHYTIKDNGLLKPWHGRVWMNPPYSTDVFGRWMGRLAEHGTGISLIFARTETAAFFNFVWQRASAVLFLQGRLNFHLVDGRRARKNGGAPSVLCAYGDRDAEVLSECGIEGHFIPLIFPRHFSFFVADEGSAARPTWCEAIVQWFSEQTGPVRLKEVYLAFAHHPKTASNAHHEAKIRQVLQHGPFVREGRGLWQLAAHEQGSAG